MRQNENEKEDVRGLIKECEIFMKQEYCFLIQQEKYKIRRLKNLSRTERITLLSDCALRVMIIITCLDFQLLLNTILIMLIILQTWSSVILTINNKILYESKVQMLSDVMLNMMQCDIYFYRNIISKLTVLPDYNKNTLESLHLLITRRVQIDLFLKNSFSSIRWMLAIYSFTIVDTELNLISIAISIQSIFYLVITNNLYHQVFTRCIKPISRAQNSKISNQNIELHNNNNHYNHFQQLNAQKQIKQDSNYLQFDDSSNTEEDTVINQSQENEGFQNALQQNHFQNTISMSEQLLGVLELLPSIIQSIINYRIIIFLENGQEVFAITALGVTIALIGILLSNNNKTSKLYITNVETFTHNILSIFSGYTTTLIYPLKQRDRIHYRVIVSLKNILSISIYIIFQSLLLFLWATSESKNEIQISQFFVILQAIVLLILILITAYKIYLIFKMRPTSVSKQFQDINSIQFNHDIIYGKVVPQQQQQLSEGDFQRLQQLLQNDGGQLQQFYIKYHNDFELLYRDGHTLIKVYQIKQLQETCRLFHTILKFTQKSFNFILDTQLITINKHSVIMFFMIRNFVGNKDSFKIAQPISYYLEFFQNLGIDFEPVVSQYSLQQMQEILRILSFNKQYSQIMPMLPSTLISDILI